MLADTSLSFIRVHPRPAERVQILEDLSLHPQGAESPEERLLSVVQQCCEKGESRCREALSRKGELLCYQVRLRGRVVKVQFPKPANTQDSDKASAPKSSTFVLGCPKPRGLRPAVQLQCPPKQTEQVGLMEIPGSSVCKIDMEQSVELDWGCLTVSDESGSRDYPINYGLSRRVTLLWKEFNGNVVEFHHPRESAPTMDSRFWSTWDRWSDAKAVYRDRIYPLCLSYLHRLVQPGCQILEICAGNGEFARNAFQERPDIGKYRLYDYDEPSLSQARSYLKAYADRVVIRQADVTLPLPDAPERAADVVFAIGALTHAVLSSRGDALKALDIALRTLRLGGYFLAMGLEHSWICAQDFEARGLVVLNRFDPETQRECYVAMTPQETRSSTHSES